MQAILWPIVSWVLREIVVKFVVVTAIFVAVVELAPLMVAQLGGFVSTSSLSSAFAGIPAGTWYFLDLARLDFGLPLLLSAAVSRFVIRRIPLIG